MDHEQWTKEQEQTTVTIDGKELELAYRDAGTGDPVIFLHGIPTWSFLWRRISPQLEHKFRTIVPDLVGYGNSDDRDSFDRSIRAQEQVVVELVNELGLETVHIVGHDIGGGIALRYAAHTDGQIDQMVLSNVTCYDSWPVEYITKLGLPQTVDMDSKDYQDTLDATFIDGLTRDDPDPTWISGMKDPWLRENGQLAFARAAVATNTNHTAEIEYSDIDVSLLCLWGEEDSEQPVEDGQRLVEDLGGRLVTLEEADHWVMEDRPQAYADRVEHFLKVSSQNPQDF